MIFGLVKGTEHPIAEHVQLAPVAADQVVEVLHPGPAPHARAIGVSGRGLSGSLAPSGHAHPCTP